MKTNTARKAVPDKDLEVTIPVDRKTLTALKILALEQGKSVQDVLNEAVRDILSQIGTVSGQQAADLIGTTLTNWRVSEWRSRQGKAPWFPKAVRPTQAETRYRKQAVIKAAEHFKSRKGSGLVKAAPTKKAPK